MKIIFTFLLVCSVAFAQVKINKAEIDSLIHTMLLDEEYTGLSIIITNPDSVLYVKNTGFSDLQTEKPLNHRTDVFRIASVSKLFTTIAVLQQVEKGVLNLDENINTYLDFEVPNEFQKPITLKHLLTHTAGFEDRIMGTYAASIDKVQPLGEYLKEEMPNIIYPPGEFTLYSNYSFALAGYIVEQVSGKSFFDYVTEEILIPLGMDSSFVYEEDEYQRRVMPSYTNEGGSFEEFKITLYRNLAPSGMVNATPYDMRKLMKLLLGNKDLSERKILSAESIKTLFATHFQYSPEMPGYGLSVYERTINGLHSMNIGGQLPSFSSYLSIVNNEIGIYACSNFSFNRPLMTLVDSIITRITPKYKAEFIDYNPVKNPQRYTGPYHWNRYSRQDMDYLKGLYSNTKEFYYDEAGYFKFYGSSDEWIYQSENLFREKSSEKYLLFDMASDGSVKGIKGNLIFDMPVYLEKFKPIEEGKRLDNIIGIMLMISLAIPVLWLIAYIIRRVRKVTSRFDRTITGKSLSVLISGFFILHLFLVKNVMNNFIDYVTGESFTVIIIYALSYIILLLLLILIYDLIRCMVKKNISLFDRIAFSLFMLNGIIYYLLMSYYKLFWFSI